MSLRSKSTPPTGVLSADEILGLCRTDEPLLTCFATENFVGAKYDLRMAQTGLILPNGTMIRPRDEPYVEDILLDSGETIFVSTEERLKLPLDLVGNMSIKGELARKGVLSLTGLIVDPGYEKGDSADGRLHFRLANLGASPIVLRPGETKIASIQFVRLVHAANALPESSLPDVWAHEENLVEGLGFIAELKKVQAETKMLSLGFEQQKRSVNLVVFGGILVILVTLLGVSLSGLLSLGADSDVVKSAKNVIPDESKGQVLAVTLILGLAAIAAGTVISLANRVGARVFELDERMLARQEALREEHLLRYRRAGLYTIGAIVLLAMSVAVPVALEFPFWVPALCAALVLLGALGLFPVLAWRAITPATMRKRIREWRSEP